MAGDYGERFETPIILVMSIVILASLAGAAGLVAAYGPKCPQSAVTYCGEQPEPH